MSSMKFCLFTFITFLPLLIFGQQHPVAFATPLQNISIDGDFQDWPNEMISYPISALAFGELSSSDDLEASFRIGYNALEHSIFVGIEVIDDIHIGKNKDNDIGAVDRVLLYMDPIHHLNGGSSVIFEASEFQKDHATKRGALSPYIQGLTWEDVEIAVSRKGTKTIYEWKIDIASLVKPNNVIGFDIIVADHDDDEDPCWILWKENTGKSYSAKRLAEVVLVEDLNNLGNLQGSIASGDKSIPSERFVRISSTNEPNLWVRAAVDSTGKYTAKLPESTYTISSMNLFTSPLLSSGFHQESRQIIAAKQVIVNTEAGADVQAPELSLKLAPLPEGYFENTGVLFQEKFLEHRIDNFIKTYQSYFKIPGVSVALIKDKKVIYNKVHGVKNNLTGDLLERNTLFEAASITKSVFAVIALKMAERGILDLDKPLSQYLEFPNISHDKRSASITARHILNHQSGLDNWPVGSYTGNLSDVKAELNFDPGTDFMYSGEAMNYLGRVVEHLSQKTLSQIFQEEIAVNFGMKNSFFAFDDSLTNRLSVGHYHTTPFYKEKFANVDSPASSLHTEANDLSKFVIGLFEQKYLSAESYRLISEPYTILEKEDKLFDPEMDQAIAHGFFVLDSPQGKVLVHGGNNGDFDCKFAYMPEQGVGFVVFTNSNMGDEFIRLLEVFLLRGLESTLTP